jgi:hypothetical protein
MREPNVSSFDEAGRLHALGTYWQSRAAQGRLPGQDILDPLSLRPWLGHLLLVDVLPGGTDFVYRLYGTNVADTFGQDMTGQSPQGFPAHHIDIIVAPYRTVVADRALRYTAHILSIDERKFAAWERVILPIANAADAVSQLLVGLYRVRVTDYARYRASLVSVGVAPAITAEPEGAFL